MCRIEGLTTQFLTQNACNQSPQDPIAIASQKDGFWLIWIWCRLDIGHGLWSRPSKISMGYRHPSNKSEMESDQAPQSFRKIFYGGLETQTQNSAPEKNIILSEKLSVLFLLIGFFYHGAGI